MPIRLIPIRLILIRKVLCWWIILNLTPLAWCAADNEPAIWYQVELIVFEQADMYGDEQPRKNVNLFYPENSRELVVPDLAADDNTASRGLNAEQSASESSELPDLAAELSGEIIGPQPQEMPAGELPFVQLDSSLHRLKPDARALDRRDSYRVLYHQAWRQPGTSRRQTPWVLLRGGQRFGDHYELEGSVRLFKSRYLHIETNLWLSHFAEKAHSAAEIQLRDSAVQNSQPSWPELPAYPIAPISDTPPAFEFDDAPRSRFSVDRIHTLNTSRKVQKTGQLHYLDHPNLGVLVQVTRYTVPTTEQEELSVPDIKDEMGDKNGSGNKVVQYRTLNPNAPAL